MKNNGFPPHQETCQFYRSCESFIVSGKDTMRQMKQMPSGLFLTYVLRLICIVGLLIFSLSFEYIVFLAVEMTVLSLIALVLPRCLRLCLLPLVIIHVFQYVNVMLTGNYMLADLLAGFMYGHGNFEQLFWTVSSAVEGCLLWIPSFWSQSYVRIGKPMAVFLAILLTATLSFNFPIHRFAVQEFYAVRNLLSDDGHRSKEPHVYRDSTELW